MILLTKSEIREIYVRYEPESQASQLPSSCETDFAFSIKNGEDPGCCGELWTLHRGTRSPTEARLYFAHTCRVLSTPCLHKRHFAEDLKREMAVPSHESAATRAAEGSLDRS